MITFGEFVSILWSMRANRSVQRTLETMNDTFGSINININNTIDAKSQNGENPFVINKTLDVYSGNASPDPTPDKKIKSNSKINLGMNRSRSNLHSIKEVSILNTSVVRRK